MPVITPRVAKIHYDQARGRWAAKFTEIRKDNYGNTFPEVREFLGTLVEVLDLLFAFWAVLPPSGQPPATFTAPLGDLAAWMAASAAHVIVQE